MLTLIPAYGRDYPSKAATLADFDAGKDFMSVGFGMPARGLATNKADLLQQGVARVNIRYKKQTQVVCVDVKD